MSQVKYVVHDGCVGCTMGAATTTLVGTSNSRIGSEIRILEPDTSPESFDGDFGICDTLTAQNGGIPTPCAMSNIPIWVNTNADLLSSSGHPGVTMSSFTVCTVGGGIIVPLEDGQSMEDFDFEAFIEGLPPELQPLFRGLLGQCAYGGDPVNMATGNFIYSQNDIEIPGFSPLSLNRYYNSMDNSDGVLGVNWTHNFNIFLEEEGKTVKITFDDGNLEEHYRRDDGTYLSPASHTHLSHNAGGYDLLVLSKLTYHFDNQGKLRSIADLNGNKTKLSYNEYGLLKKVSNDCGTLYFTYNKKGQIIKVVDHGDRAVSYQYNDRFLISVTHPDGGVYRYEYNENGTIKNIINPLGIKTVSNEYDNKNRTVKQQYPDGGVTVIAYDDKQYQTVNTQQNGNSVIFKRDGEFRTTGIVYENGEESFTYNKDNKRTSFTDRNGNVSLFSYDQQGNLIQEIDPLGGTLSTEYDECNLPIKITGPLGDCTTLTRDESGNIIQVENPLGHTINIKNDSRGLISTILLPDGSESLLEYDKRGNTISITENGVVVAAYVYDSLNRVVKTVNGEGNVTKFQYNSRGDIVTATNADGRKRRYAYSLSDKVTQITDFDGSIIEFSYNEMDKIEEIKNQTGGNTRFTYDLMGNATCVTDPNGNTVQYEYDQYQRVVRSIDEEGNATLYEHDPKGNVTAIISPLGARTEMKYDALDRRQEIVEPDGAVTRFSYDKGGNLTEVTDALGNTTKREYDLIGQLVKMTDALGNETRFTYTPLGQLESVIDANNEQATYSYYPGGKLKTATLPGGESETYEYDRNGNAIKIIDALGGETRLIRDDLDRVIEFINPLGYSKKFEYDPMGNITQITDENGNATQYRYSLLGNIIEVIDPEGHSAKYDYDKAGRLVKQEQVRLVDSAFTASRMEEHQITTYQRNKKGELVAVKTPLGKMVEFTYNMEGNVVSKVDEDGLETLYDYNRVGKLSKVSYADGKTVKLGYDALRRLTLMQDWLGTTSIELDELGRAAKITDFEGKEVGYAWDAVGRKEKLIYPDGAEVCYQYNASGRMRRVTSEQGETHYSYDPMGRLKERILPDNTTTKYELDYLGRPTELTHSRGGDILDWLQYTYDPAGNISRVEKQRIGVETDSGVFEYGYDSLNRLCAMVKGEQVKRYRYDEVGNRVKEWCGLKSDAINWTQHFYNTGNQLVKTAQGDSVREYRYDNRGNMTQVAENGQLKAKYTFDSANMMVGALVPNKGAAEYSYDGLCNRVKKLEQFTATAADMPDPVNEVRYILDMTLPYNNLLMTQGASRQRFTWGKELLSANGDKSFHYLQDHLGSPIRLVGEALDDVFAYDEFGVSLLETDQIQPFGFTGYQLEAVSGDYFAQARYYQPTLGRFAAEDLLKGNLYFPISLNPYVYCAGNPLAFIDPDGLDYMPPAVIQGNEAHDLLPTYLKTQYPALAPNIGYRGQGSGIPGAGANGGYGYPDMTYTKNGITEVYEIKPSTYAIPGTPQNIAGLAQLDRYITGLQAQGKNAQAGTALNTFINCTTIPSVKYPGSQIKYFTVSYEPGMIYYQYIHPKKEEATVPATEPEKKEEKSLSIDYEAAKTAGKVGLGAAAAYGAYRLLRLLPSLVPPLWPTLVPNLLAP